MVQHIVFACDWDLNDDQVTFLTQKTWSLQKLFSLGSVYIKKQVT